MAEQAELNLRMKAARAVTRDSIEELCQLLRGRGWQTSREIRKLRPLWNERFIRLLASASKGRVISGPGTPGYCLATEATDTELEHAGRAQLSQGRNMVRRGLACLRLLSLRKQVAEASHGATPTPRNPQP